MSELFAGFLQVSLSGCLTVCVVLLLRMVLRRTSKALICAVWLLTFLRLLLPFPIETNWSVRPELPAFSHQVTQPVAQTPVHSGSAVPEDVIHSTYVTPPAKSFDAMQIAGVVWSVGAAGMLLYALGSYLRLKKRVSEAVKLQSNIYHCPGLKSAFLLGYFAPKIYLPGGLDAKTEALVIQHERSHIKRLDHWLKLIGFFCLSLHWFNPMVWVAYAVLCRDIEDACDEQVIRDLGVQDRKSYSEALLACGKEKSALSVCPVAFGEISIRQRIVNILHYRKPAAWICVITALLIVLVAVFFMTDPMEKHPPYYQELMDLLGEPVETVCQELELSRDALVETQVYGIYNAPLTAQFRDIPFRIQLCFDRGNQLLCSFCYIAEYEGGYQQIAKPASALAKHLLKAHGKVYQWEQLTPEQREFITSEEGILALFSEKPDRAYEEQWDLTKCASKSAKTYLDQIEVSSIWQEQYAQRARRYGISPHFYLSFRAFSNQQENKSYVMLEYKTGWQPGHYYSSIQSDTDLTYATYSESRSWWDSVLDWLK